MTTVGPSLRETLARRTGTRAEDWHLVFRARHGMLVVLLNISSQDGGVITGPDIITRGFIYVKEAEELIGELKEIVLDSVYYCSNSKKGMDVATLKNVIKSDLSAYLYKKTRRNPMILPVVTVI